MQNFQEIICYHSTSTAQTVEDGLDETNYEETVLFVEIAKKTSANQKPPGRLVPGPGPLKKSSLFSSLDPWKKNTEHDNNDVLCERDGQCISQ